MVPASHSIHFETDWTQGGVEVVMGARALETR